MILLIDNYDSFTYNLYHYIAAASSEAVKVVRNDKITIDEIKKLAPKAVVLSPGPCTPSEAGICLDVIENFKKTLPILGVCLGHQAIGQAFGGKVIKTYPMHGKISDIYHHQDSVFKDLPSPFKATRYHSLIIEKNSLPDCLQITATTKDEIMKFSDTLSLRERTEIKDFSDTTSHLKMESGIIMGVKHKNYNIHGVQFHPESIASEHGHQLIKNFLKLANV